MKTSFSKFKVGLTGPIRGLELIFSNRRVRHVAIIPFALVLCTFLFGTIFLLPKLFILVPWLAHMAIAAVGLSPGTFATALLYYLLLLIAAPVGISALLFVLFLISQLIATPFYAILAERALGEKGLKKDEPFHFGQWIKISSHLIMVAVVKIAIFSIVGLVLFVISFVPGLGIISAFGFLMITAYDIVDVSLEALRMGLKERFQFFRSEFPAFVGLACTLGLVFLIPGLNFFLFPASIAGSYAIIKRARSGG